MYMVTIVTCDPDESRRIPSDFVTILTVGAANPLENKGFGGADSTKIGYLLIPSCGSRVSRVARTTGMVSQSAYVR